MAMDFETIMARAGGSDCREKKPCDCDRDRDCNRCDRDRDRDRDCDRDGDRDRRRRQRHVHEVQGSTQVFGCCNDAHNHRFATVSGEAIQIGGNDHVHEICFHTDFADGHYHEFKGRTGGAVFVGGGRHVHFAEARTEEEDGHRHCFRVASLIDSPIDK